jgi:hypothetical protein
MYDENYRVVKNINMLSFYDLEHTHSLRLAKMSKEDANQFLEESHSEFLSGLKKKGEAIDVEKYATAYYETLIRNGVTEEKAKEIVDKKINYTIARASITLSEESQSKFIADKLTEEFLEENLSEYEFINFGIKEFEREDLDKLPAEQREEILVLLQQMRKRRKQLLMTEEEGNKRNKKIIKETLEKN